MCFLEDEDSPKAAKIFEAIEKVFEQHDTPWNYNTNRNNMQENLLLYAQLSLQVAYCCKC